MASGIPNVSFITQNGQLGGINPIDDGVAGLIVSHAAVASLPLNTPHEIFKIEDAEKLLITGSALQEIKDFYLYAGEGQALWIMLTDKATLMADICKEAVAGKLLQASNGAIRIWGLGIERDASYKPDVTEGIDKDVYDAMLAAQITADSYADKYTPTRMILPGRAYDGDVSKLRDLKTAKQNRIQISLLGSKGSKEGKVGYLLGLYASKSVQTNVGKVADGDIGLSETCLTDGTTTAEDNVSTENAMHDKGYIFPIKRPGKSGYFFNDDPMATSNTDDYSSFARGRIMDKVQRIAYGVYVEFMNDDFGVDLNGNLSVVELKRLQSAISDTINATMVATNEISSFEAFVDPTQDVITNGLAEVELRVQPRGYYKHIIVKTGFIIKQQ